MSPDTLKCNIGWSSRGVPFWKENRSIAKIIKVIKLFKNCLKGFWEIFMIVIIYFYNYHFLLSHLVLSSSQFPWERLGGGGGRGSHYLIGRQHF